MIEVIKLQLRSVADGVRAGTNMLARQWAFALEKHGIPVVAIHRTFSFLMQMHIARRKHLLAGVVETRMNPEDTEGMLTVKDSATGVYDVISNLTLEKVHEGILAYDGTTIPW